jgi:hypothetical protein
MYTNTMNILATVPIYIRWHYTCGIVESIELVKRLLLNVLHFFSVSVILRTFFSPWKREGMRYAHSEVGSWFTTFIFNSLMRVLGMVMRTVILFFGLVIFLCSCIFSVVIILGWILAPLVMVGSFVMGVINLLNI